MRKRHTVFCGLPGSTTCFPHYLTKGTILEKKKVTGHKMRFYFVGNISNSKEN
jgi:hypothetical protein